MRKRNSIKVPTPKSLPRFLQNAMLPGQAKKMKQMFASFCTKCRTLHKHVSLKSFIEMKLAIKEIEAKA